MEFNPGAFRDIARSALNSVGQSGATTRQAAPGHIGETEYRQIAAQYAAAAKHITPAQMEQARAHLGPWLKQNIGRRPQDEEAAAAELVDAVFRNHSFEEYQNGVSQGHKRVERVKDEKKKKG